MTESLAKKAHYCQFSQLCCISPHTLHRILYCTLHNRHKYATMHSVKSQTRHTHCGPANGSGNEEDNEYCVNIAYNIHNDMIFSANSTDYFTYWEHFEFLT